MENQVIVYAGYILGILGLIWGAFSYGKKANQGLISVEFCTVMRGVIHDKLEDIKKNIVKMDDKIERIDEKVDIKVSSLKILIEEKIK